MGIEDVSTVDFIDRPSQDRFLNAFKQLIKLGAVDPQSAKITKFGHEMAVMPTEPIFSKLLLTSLNPLFQTIQKDIVILVSMLSVENIFFNTSSESQQIILKKRKKILHEESDHLTLIKLFKSYKIIVLNQSRAMARKFCQEIGVSEKSLVKAA